MGRKPIFDRPMTTAERNRRYRAQFVRKDGADDMSEEKKQYLTMPAPPDRMSLQAQRVVVKAPSLNDAVDDLFVRLYDLEEHPRFYNLVIGAVSSDTVEGSTVADDYAAAQYMIEYAKAHEVPVIREKKWHTVMLALRVVMKRVGMARKDRRVEVHGEQIDLDLNGEAG